MKLKIAFGIFVMSIVIIGLMQIKNPVKKYAKEVRIFNPEKVDLDDYKVNGEKYLQATLFNCSAPDLEIELKNKAGEFAEVLYQDYKKLDSYQYVVVEIQNSSLLSFESFDDDTIEYGNKLLYTFKVGRDIGKE